jgi:hypothetical protein
MIFGGPDGGGARISETALSFLWATRIVAAVPSTSSPEVMTIRKRRSIQINQCRVCLFRRLSAASALRDLSNPRCRVGRPAVYEHDRGVLRDRGFWVTMAIGLSPILASAAIPTCAMWMVS